MRNFEFVWQVAVSTNWPVLSSVFNIGLPLMFVVLCELFMRNYVHLWTKFFTWYLPFRFYSLQFITCVYVYVVTLLIQDTLILQPFGCAYMSFIGTSAECTVLQKKINCFQLLSELRLALSLGVWHALQFPWLSEQHAAMSGYSVCAAPHGPCSSSVYYSWRPSTHG